MTVPSQPRRPDAVVFDVVETLASLDPVRDRLVEVGQPAEAFPAWFTRLLRDAFALAAAGSYRPFAEVAGSALTSTTGGDLSADQVSWVVEGFGTVTPQPDAAAGLRAARDAGCRVLTLSNGSLENSTGFLERAGLRDLVDDVLSIDQVEAWKPGPAPYALAVERAGVPADRVALVAVHSWDVHGARRAGLTTGWAPRLEGAPVTAFDRADVVADTLPDVVRALAELPRG